MAQIAPLMNLLLGKRWMSHWARESDTIKEGVALREMSFSRRK